jgi:hypothetical protein
MGMRSSTKFALTPGERLTAAELVDERRANWPDRHRRALALPKQP